MLVLDELRAGYASAPVLHGVHLSLGPTECVTVLGRNGVGKTTLIRAISGAVACTGGSITFDGTDLGPLKAHERARLGIAHVPQGRDIFPKALGTREPQGRHGGAPGPKHRRRRQDPGGVSDGWRSDGALVATTSRGGQQQMLALARALVTEPRLLLLDEPSEGIQPSVLDDIAGVIGRINTERGIAVLAVEQNLDFAARIARRGLIMDKGEIITEVDTGRTAPRPCSPKEIHGPLDRPDPPRRATPRGHPQTANPTADLETQRSRQ